jgi:predicted O-methyltransferase YrrM
MPSTLTLFLIGFLPASLVALRLDLRRRKLSPVDGRGWNVATVLDVVCVSCIFGLAAFLVLTAPNAPISKGPLTPATFGVFCCAAALLFLWPEGRRQIQLQRPAGIVAAESALLFGAASLVTMLLFQGDSGWPGSTGRLSILLATVLPLTCGALLLGIVVPPFVKGREGHRILDRIAAQGEFVQQEWVSASPECPFPERWHMMDAQSAELEVLEFLKSLVVTVKPDLIVETGTFIGHSAIKMAEGLRDNGFGKIITIEYDPAIFAKANQNIEASGLAKWIESRNASSLDSEIEGSIDILYSDSETSIRESEIRRFLPQIKPRGLVLVHDAGSHFKVVREAALRLEQEGLLSVVLLSTPRGLVVAQKREERT